MRIHQGDYQVKERTFENDRTIARFLGYEVVEVSELRNGTVVTEYEAKFVSDVFDMTSAVDAISIDKQIIEEIKNNC